MAVEQLWSSIGLRWPIRANVACILGPAAADAVQLQEQVAIVPDVAGPVGVEPILRATAPTIIAECDPNEACAIGTARNVLRGGSARMG